MRGALAILLFGLAAWHVTASCRTAQAQPWGRVETSEPEGSIEAPGKVDVLPAARDDEIRRRLLDILEATGWFSAFEVAVRDGVVFLSGRAQTAEVRQWAGNLARNTQGVVAVANRMTVLPPSVWDFGSAREGLAQLGQDLLRALPFFFLGVVVLALSVVASWLMVRVTRSILKERVRSRLMRGVFAWTVGAFVLVAGLYIVLRVSGLTQLALTVVGGTGLVGLALGIAFRNITENFLASIFLSMQRPFETGDLIEVVGKTGYVQQLNVRATILMTLDGNIVQVPNATMYKESIRNFTASPNRQEEFTIGVGYEEAIDRVQEIALAVMAEHPAVLQEPEPLVLADALGKATVDMKIYFWFNGIEHNNLKVRSSVIRLVKRAFQMNGVTMPDEAREVIFPRSVPVVLLDDPKQVGTHEPASRNRPTAEPSDAVSTQAEAGLASDAGILKAQAQGLPSSGLGDNLLKPESKARGR
jgi:small conductance mechanosensitive channel